MLHIAICDDEPIIAEKIKNIVVHKMNESGEELEVTMRFSGKNIIEELSSNPADLILLDIDMPEISGIEVASKLYEMGLNNSIIFVTNHANLVFETLKYHPFQFVRKERMVEELPQVLENFMSIYHRDNKVLEISTEDGTHLISIYNILYIEKIERKLCIFCTNGQEFQTWASLKDIEKEYSNNGFCRIHYSILVNLKYVAEIENSEVVMDNELRLPLSRGRRKEVKQHYIEYMRKL